VVEYLKKVICLIWLLLLLLLLRASAHTSRQHMGWRLGVASHSRDLGRATTRFWRGE